MKNSNFKKFWGVSLVVVATLAAVLVVALVTNWTANFGVSQETNWGTLPKLEAQPQKAASHFFLNDVRGVGYDSRQVMGKKPLLIIFSTTWCPACNAYLPDFKRLYSRYAPRGLEIIGVNLGESLPKVASWIAKNNVPYRILIDESQDIGRRYGIMGVPGLVLIDKKGSVICNPCQSLAEIERALD